jgi:molybdate transport system substrate-binding protein
MKRTVRCLGSAVAVGLMMAQPAVSAAAEIRLLCANGMKDVVEELGPRFERATGHKLIIAFANLGNIVKRIGGGETADVVIIPRQGIVGLVKAGTADANRVTAIASGGLGVAVRKGAPRPDIATPDALRRALLAAASITYLDPVGGGVSGTHFVKVLDRLGIAGEMKSKTILHRDSHEAAALIEKGKAEVGVNLVQELLPKPGIDLVGPLPGDLQLRIPYAAAILAGAVNAAAAQALVDFLRTAESAAVIKAKGLEPD